ncbi:MAG: hypothetical protein AAF740_14850, partial [Bacteroidota bacterium]
MADQASSRIDFKVKYRFYTPEEGGREYPYFQGARCDFWYEAESHTLKGIFMIWPEFEDENGEVLPFDPPEMASPQGTARMVIVSRKMRAYHQE